MSFSQGISSGLGLGQAFQQGRSRREEERLRGQIDLSQPLAGQDAFKQLASISPASASKLKSALKTDEQGINAAFQDAAVFKSQLQADPTGQRGVQFLQNRVQSGESQGRDMFLTKGLLQTAMQSPEAALQEVDSFLSIPNQFTQMGQNQLTANQKDFRTFQQLLKDNPEKAKRFGRKAGFIRETEQEKSNIKVTETERKAVAKANVNRRQGFIDSGIEAANGAANLRRALNLLDETPTGGVDNLALKAKQLFGIEGANEGELSNLMGKAVLAQLKPIFGAAFTAREGDALAALEAKFSNSPASNKRLIENALKIVDRASRRGIAAAESQNDEFTANEIREALAFDISEKPTEQQPTQQAQGVFTSPALGRDISEQDITDTLQANPGLTREALLQQLGIQ